MPHDDRDPTNPLPASASEPDDARSTSDGAAASGPDASSGPDGDTDHAAAGGSRRRPRRARTARTTRTVLAFLAVGGLAVGATTFLLTDRDAQHQPSRVAHSSGSAAATALGATGVGDCLDWSAPDSSDMATVPCEGTHMFEVVGAVDLGTFPGSEWSPGSRFPTVTRFTALRDELCAPAVRDYLDGRFDPSGRFRVGLINPGEDQWTKGDRTLRCGLQYKLTTGAPAPFTGSVIGQDQSRTWPAGTCIGIDQGMPTDPVDCARPHAFEVVSEIDLGSQFPNGRPSTEDQDKYLEQRCTEDVTAFLGTDRALRDKTLTQFWDNLDYDSWLAGSRRVTCSIGKQVEGGFSSITGSARGDILIDGQPPVPPPDEPAGRSLPTPLPGAAPLADPQG